MGRVCSTIFYLSTAIVIILNIDIWVDMTIKDNIVIHKVGELYGYPSFVRIPNGIAVIPTHISAKARDVTKIYIAWKANSCSNSGVQQIFTSSVMHNICSDLLINFLCVDIVLKVLNSCKNLIRFRETKTGV